MSQDNTFPDPLFREQWYLVCIIIGYILYIRIFIGFLMILFNFNFNFTHYLIITHVNANNEGRALFGYPIFNFTGVHGWKTES